MQLGDAKILVVEDELITAEDIKSGLEFAGYTVPAIVSSGEDAIEKAGELKPDLVLMDIKLKGEMDGIEAAGQIRVRYDIPVIYLTAYSDETTVQRAKVTEPSGYILKERTGLIKKPFEESELHTAIEITLYRHKIEKDHDRLFSAMLGSINQGIIATDSDGRIKLVNENAESLIGWKESEVVGKDLKDFLEDFNDLTSFKEKVSSNDGAEFKNIEVVSKDGSKVSLKGKVAVIKDENGEEDGFIVTFSRS
ncbi:putative transcriptional regulatory protein pdtaR [Methanobacterium congolense]|uniref:Putative transcriptional regulatory protein pdtaR n=1 Tax=Methanobacterium congolense TaxID=118062 RepID=A0A1D3KZ72_9EURY|nr:putative transcriptional regulatory protein pdtaR [Methanobacterium congolense]